ncbi:hypothetical protein FIM1_4308 [Kluyveromyces marxianus]|uniref:Uncharacterized protein n=1 Tax=Kluyveromyces marxianus TaxID=4911 RepID=A0ABX6EYZ8_KLUMA|nr:hypothetical protein FIM1_4308 [Kluyveromyces marxianus]
MNFLYFFALTLGCAHAFTGLVIDKVFGKSHGPGMSCNTLALKVNIPQNVLYSDGSYGLDITPFIAVLYKYSRDKNGCKTRDTDSLTETIIAAIKDNRHGQKNLIASCLTLFRSRSTVTYLKYVKEGAGVEFGAIDCQAVPGWRAPNFLTT